MILSVVLAAGLVCAAPALAAPPATGTKAPIAGNSHTIPADYVGLAQVGPRSYCDTAEETGAGAGICADVRPGYTRMWLRSGTTGWRAGKFISTEVPDYVFVTPYAAGWHWVVSLRFGVFALPTRSLSLMSPSHY